jgi:hypothetical protein
MHTMKRFPHQRPFRVAVLLGSLVQARAEVSATALEIPHVTKSRAWQQCVL